jgi:hypothetical protein
MLTVGIKAQVEGFLMAIEVQNYSSFGREINPVSKVHHV